MLDKALDGLMSEVRQHPWTTITAAIALFGMALMLPTSLRTETLFDEVSALKTEVRLAQALTSRRQYEAELARLDQAIFELEARMQELRRTEVEPDRFYARRLNELKHDKARVERNLTEFLRAHPELADAR
jgi:DNA repair exonuclease SbcCD ATPase subunit